MLILPKRNRRIKGTTIADRYLTAKERKYMAWLEGLKERQKTQ